MATTTIPEKVQHFIFEYIDSVEQLDILLFLRVNKGQWFTADQIGKDLRLNSNSVKARLSLLKNQSLIDSNHESPEAYAYTDRAAELERVLEDLTLNFRIKKHKILELIFSPAKKARQFADAFAIGRKSSGEGENNG